jgi:hypothetical protein
MISVDVTPTGNAAGKSAYCAGATVVTVKVTYQFPIVGPYEPLIAKDGIIPITAEMKSVFLQPEC